MKNLNIIKILSFLNAIRIEYREYRGAALVSLTSALAPLSEIFCILNQKALAFFIGFVQIPMPFGLLFFYLGKINNY